MRETKEAEQQLQGQSQPKQYWKSKDALEQEAEDELTMKLKAKVLKLKKKLQEKADRVKELEPLEAELKKSTETSRLLQERVDQLDI